MTVEELEIIVSAKIDQIKPQIQKVVKEIKNAVKETDGIGSELFGKVDTAKIAKDVQKVKKQAKEIFDPNDTSGLKINGPAVIKGINQSFKELKGQKIDLNNVFDLSQYRRKLEQATTTAQKAKEKLSNSKFMSYDANAVMNKVNLLSNGNTSKLKNDLKESKKHGENLASSTKKVKAHLEGAKAGSKLLTNGLNKAKSIANGVSSKLKVGLGQILKTAGALLSLRSIYNILQNSASAWLSSQNSEAQQLQANLDYMKYALGSSLKPVIETIVNLIYQALKGVQSLIYALTGVNIFANASAKAYSSMANSAKDAKKESQALADIDEIHNIQEDTGSSGGSGSGGANPNFDLSGVETADWLKKILENVKNGNWYEIGASIGTKINESLEKIPWDKIKTTASNAGRNIAKFLNGGIENTNWKLVGNTIAEGVNTSINFAHSFATTFNWKAFGKSISDTINGFFEKVDWIKAGETVSEGIKGVLDTLVEYIENLDVGLIQDAALDFLFNIDWAGVFGKLIKLLVKLVIQGIEAPINLAIKAAKKLADKLPPSMRGAFASLKEIHLEDSILSLGSYEAELYNIQEQAKKTAKGTEESIGGLKTVTVKTFDELEDKAFPWAKNTASNYNEGIKSQESNTNGIFSRISTTMQNALDRYKNSKSWANNIASNYNNGLNGQQSGLVSVLTRIKDKVKSYLNQSGSSSSWGISTASKYKEGINGQNGALTSVLNSFTSKIKNSLNQSGSSYTWGYDMIQGFMNGINAIKSKLTTTVSNIASSIRSFLHFSRPDEGPLRDYETWMPDMIEGLSNSLLKASPRLDNAVSQVSDNIASNLKATTLGVDVNSSVTKTINTNISSQLENAVYSAIQKAENLFKLAINSEIKLNGKTIAQEIIDDLNNEAKRRGYKAILQRG